MKRKNLNPVCIVLNRNFSEVSETIAFVIVTKTENNIVMELFNDAETVCNVIHNIETSENKNIEVSVYVKQPFTQTFVSGKKIIFSVMKKYFPEIAESEIISEEKIDEVSTEIVEVVETIEVAPKKIKK